MLVGSFANRVDGGVNETLCVVEELFAFVTTVPLNVAHDHVMVSWNDETARVIVSDPAVLMSIDGAARLETLGMVVSVRLPLMLIVPKR